MSTHKFQVKLYLSNPEALDLEAVIPVFHEFIRENTLADFVIDVADYGHVQDGPGVVLVGHGSDYYLEQREGRPGLLYSRKRDGSGDAGEALTDALRRAVRAAGALEAKSALGLRFSVDEVLVRINDRLHAPNTDATLESLRGVLESVLGKALGAGPALAREGSERDLFSVRARAQGGSLADVAARLG